MLCPTCGLMNATDAKACARCTHPFSENERTEAAHASPNIPVPKVAPPEEKRRSFGFKLMLIIIFLLLFVLIGGGILASVVTASLEVARSKGRDAVRIAAIAQLKLSAELYYDQNGEYPVRFDDLLPDYLSAVPTDPVSDQPYHYKRCAKYSYHLAATLEMESAALERDTDATALCAGDPIIGADSGPCLTPPAEASGRCYDVVITTEAPAPVAPKR